MRLQQQAFAMTGYRLGYLAGPKPVVKVLASHAASVAADCLHGVSYLVHYGGRGCKDMKGRVGGSLES